MSDLVRSKNHLTRRKQSVSSISELCGACVRLLAADGEGKPFVGLHAGDDADMFAFGFEDGTLFDMKFEVGGYGSRLAGGSVSREADAMREKGGRVNTL